MNKGDKVQHTTTKEIGEKTDIFISAGRRVTNWYKNSTDK